MWCDRSCFLQVVVVVEGDEGKSAVQLHAATGKETVGWDINGLSWKCYLSFQGERCKANYCKGLSADDRKGVLNDKKTKTTIKLWERSFTTNLSQSENKNINETTKLAQNIRTATSKTFKVPNILLKCLKQVKFVHSNETCNIFR